MGKEAVKLIILKNDQLEVELIDPSRPGNLGNRFCGGAWIRNVRGVRGRYAFFVEESIKPHVPEFGCPQEFITSLPLGSADDGGEQLMKVGVGLVERKEGAHRFQDRIEEVFGWEAESDSREAHFVQKSGLIDGYSYSLEQRVRLEGDRLLIDNRLLNKGMRRIETTVYVHPFFCERNLDGCYWFQVPQKEGEDSAAVLAERKGLEEFPPPDTRVEQHRLCPDHNWISTGSTVAGTSFEIRSEQTFCRLNLWREAGVCYAIEPFIPVVAEPGQTAVWQWQMVVGENLASG